MYINFSSFPKFYIILFLYWWKIKGQGLRQNLESRRCLQMGGGLSVAPGHVPWPYPAFGYWLEEDLVVTGVQEQRYFFPCLRMKCFIAEWSLSSFLMQAGFYYACDVFGVYKLVSSQKVSLVMLSKHKSVVKSPPISYSRVQSCWES